MYDDFINNAIDLGLLNSHIFSKVPIVVYDEGLYGEHEIIMGLKHISGNKKWPALNQAQLIYDLLINHNWTEDNACESLGISKHELKRSLRTISLIKDFKASDYGDQFDTDMFAIFREIISSRPLKSWIEWDDTNKVPKNYENAERLYSWLSQITEIKEDEYGEESVCVREPAITKSAEIGTLSKIIDDSNAINELEEKRNITDAYSASSSVGDDKYEKAIVNIDLNIDDAYSFAKYAKLVNKEKILELKHKLEGLLISQGHKDIVVSKGVAKEILINYKTKQLSSISFPLYKSFKKDLTISNLNRVNIIAGENNVGKSSFLEAVYLLTSQNDLNELFELYRRRGKFVDKFPIDWFNKEFNSYELNGVFDGKVVKTSASIDSEKDESIDKSDYLNSLTLTSSFNGDKILTSKARLFTRKNIEQYYEKICSICATSYSSPFTMLSKELINEYHEISVKKGVYDKLIEFVSKNIDTKIKKITKVGDSNQIRFLVEHDDFDVPVDLTQFGEGLQRVFYISLQIAAAENGIMCIDEIENAIHHSLLVEFTSFLQKIAEEFHVQLFISTHSNECIKAFFENGYNNEEITGYKLVNSEDGVVFKAAKGFNLQNQIENFNLDIRG